LEPPQQETSVHQRELRGIGLIAERPTKRIALLSESARTDNSTVGFQLDAAEGREHVAGGPEQLRDGVELYPSGVVVDVDEADVDQEAREALVTVREDLGAVARDDPVSAGGSD